MTVRTSSRTVAFAHPFSLSGIETMQPAGIYIVETDEELLDGLSFPAYRRLTTVMILPRRPGTTEPVRIVAIDPLELEAAQARDADAGAGGVIPR